LLQLQLQLLIFQLQLQLLCQIKNQLQLQITITPCLHGTDSDTTVNKISPHTMIRVQYMTNFTRNISVKLQIYSKFQLLGGKVRCNKFDAVFVLQLCSGTGATFLIMPQLIFAQKLFLAIPYPTPQPM
jgi:hypothetical protein